MVVWTGVANSRFYTVLRGINTAVEFKFSRRYELMPVM